jgi:hypothetical protein
LQKQAGADHLRQQHALVMKNKSFIFILLLALTGAMAVPTFAAENDGKVKKPSKTTLKRFDKDKDGVLNEEEEAAWNADKEKARQKRAEKKRAKEQAGGESAK